jgi:hypothetical protein
MFETRFIKEYMYSNVNKVYKFVVFQIKWQIGRSWFNFHILIIQSISLHCSKNLHFLLQSEL